MQLTAEQIRSLIPHRDPILLVDEVDVNAPGEQGRGICNLAEHPQVFEGHFPAQPVMPGVLVVECMAQVAAVVFAAAGLQHDAADHRNPQPDNTPQSLYLARIESAKFLTPVTPGSVLIVDVTLVKRFGAVARVACVARLDDEAQTLAASAQLVLSGS